ncbi:hypothetical protein X975_25438, partial [Stegodyphus mimosarum]
MFIHSSSKQTQQNSRRRCGGPMGFFTHTFKCLYNSSTREVFFSTATMYITVHEQGSPSGCYAEPCIF